MVLLVFHFLSQVDEEIEKLKMKQMEKHLELKEAATRRKIQALKQQLKSGRDPEDGNTAMYFPAGHGERSRATNNVPLQTSAPVTRQVTTKISPLNPWDMSKSPGDQLMASVNGEWRAVPQPHRALEAGGLRQNSLVYSPSSRLAGESAYTSHVLHSTGTTAQSSQVSAREGRIWVNSTGYFGSGQRIEKPNRDMLQSTDHIPTDLSSSNYMGIKKSSTDSAPFHAITTNDDIQYSPGHSKYLTKHALTSVNHQTSPPPFLTSPPSSNGYMTVTSCTTSQPSSSDHMISSLSSDTHMTSPAPSSSRREKLTIPEEIKETEYMNAIQRQKARVSRIRRCIVAATVIQRAWRRRYRDML